MNIPYPDKPFNIENLRTIPLLEEQGFEGPDVSLEHSLFEYDCVWRKIPPELVYGGEDFLFVFNVGKDDDGHPVFAREGKCSQDFEKDFCWVDEDGWQSFFSANGQDREEWLQLPYPVRIYDALSYWGWMNVFGSTVYGGAFTIRDPQKDYGSSPMPGESPDDYYARLVSGEPDRGEPWIPMDFVRTKTGAWFASPDFGSWLCHWHSGMDRVYAAGSTVIANLEVPLDVLEDAINLMERNQREKIERGELHDAMEALALVGVMQAALNAKPSEEPQYAEL